MFLCDESYQIEKKRLVTLFSDVPRFLGSVSNLSGSAPSKSGFCTWFRKYGANNKVWDNKKAMLCGKYQQKLKNGIFWRQKMHQKMPFFDFRWDLPHSMAFLLSQTWLFAPNFLNQVQKYDFEGALPLRLDALPKKRGTSENSVTRHFFSIWWLPAHKKTPNYILTKFEDIPLAKSMILSGPKLLLEIMNKQQKSVPKMFKILAQLPLKWPAICIKWSFVKTRFAGPPSTYLCTYVP